MAKAPERQDVDELNLSQLYELRLVLRNRMGARHEATKKYVDRRFEGETAALGMQPQEISEHLSFILVDVAHLEGDWYMFRFVFKINKAINADYRIYFHGNVDESQVRLLPPTMREQGFMMWNFDPPPDLTVAGKRLCHPDTPHSRGKNQIWTENRLLFGRQVFRQAGPVWLGKIDFDALHPRAPAPTS